MSDAASLDAALEAFDERYRRYLDDLTELKSRTIGVRRASTFWSQRRPFADDPIHAQALAELTALAAEVTAALEPRSGGGERLVTTVRLVLGEKRIDQAEYWPLVALEGLAKPWLASLQTTDAAEVYRAYARANPRSGCLPNQREIRKEFERVLKG